jgi:dTMP kinase
MGSTRGVFISFESIDGVGKSTQVKLLGETLTLAGYDVVLRREPGSSNVGAGVRDLLFKSPTTKQMARGVADALFLADHVQNAADIEQDVSQGKVVLCDRYADSQFAYAASVGKNCPRWALDAYDAAFGIVPDITVLLLARGPRGLRSCDSDADLMHEDIGWALERAQARRGIEAGKQDGKAWNSIQDQLRIQEAYVRRLVQMDPGTSRSRRTVVVNVHKEDNIATVRAAILWGVLDRGLLQSAHPDIQRAIEGVSNRIIVANGNPEALAT